MGYETDEEEHLMNERKAQRKREREEHERKEREAEEAQKAAEEAEKRRAEEARRTAEEAEKKRAEATVPAKVMMPEAKARHQANALENLRLMKKHAPKASVLKRKANAEDGPSTGPGTKGGAKAPRSKGPEQVSDEKNIFFDLLFHRLREKCRPLGMLPRGHLA